jgi:hypothetical protein
MSKLFFMRLLYKSNAEKAISQKNTEEATSQTNYERVCEEAKWRPNAYISSRHQQVLPHE